MMLIFLLKDEGFIRYLPQTENINLLMDPGVLSEPTARKNMRTRLDLLVEAKQKKSKRPILVQQGQGYNNSPVSQTQGNVIH